MKYSASGIAFTSALLLSVAAMAQAPALIPVQGFLTDDQGDVRDGEVFMDLRLFDSAIDGAELHSESQVVDVDSGFFSTEMGLGDELDLAVFLNNGSVWVEVEVDEEVFEPRLQFGTAPYAAWAEWAGDAQTVGGLTVDELNAPPTWAEIEGVPADLLDGDDDTTDWAELTGVPEDLLDGDDVGEDVDLSGYQLRVSGECPDGATISTIAADGAVTCETDDDTIYDAGSGLSLTGTTFNVDASEFQARITADCPAGFSIRAIAEDGTVQCEEDTDTDTDTTYEAGSGLSLTSTTFAVDAAVMQARVTGSCPAGQSIRAIAEDGTVTCHIDIDTDTDTDTTYTAGTGLALSGTTFAVDTAATQARVAGSCPTGQSIRAIAENGTVTCQVDTNTDTDTTYSAGTGLDLSGTTFNVDSTDVQARVSSSCPTGESIRVINIDGSVVCQSDTDTNTTYSAGAGLNLSGTTFAIPTDGVNSDMLATDSVNSSAIANDAVGSGEIAADAVGTSEIADQTVVESDLNLQGMGTVSSETGEVMLSRFLTTTALNGVTTGRVMIVTGGTQGRGSNSSGAGTAVVACGTTTIETIDLSGSGFRPWTYITPSFSLSSCSSLDVTISADSSASPILVREITFLPGL